MNSIAAQLVKNLPAVQEIQVQPLGWEDPLEMKMATHSSTLAWRIPWVEEPGGLQSTGSQRVGHYFTFTFTFEHSLALPFFGIGMKTFLVLWPLLSFPNLLAY